MKRFDENSPQNDSVKAEVDELFNKSTAGLQGTDREKLVGIAIAVSNRISSSHARCDILVP